MDTSVSLPEDFGVLMQKQVGDFGVLMQEQVGLHVLFLDLLLDRIGLQ